MYIPIIHLAVVASVFWGYIISPFWNSFLIFQKFFQEHVIFKGKENPLFSYQLGILASNSSSWDSIFCFSYSVSYAINPF